MRSRFVHLSLAALLASCAGGPSPRSGSDPDRDEPASSDAPEGRRAAGATNTPEPEPPGDIPFYENGELVGTIAEVTAERRGLTLLDLGDDWTPRVFAEDESLGRRGTQPLRRRLVRLANEETRDQRRDPTERYLELFGISPTFHVLSQRLSDTARHECHDAVDDAPIAAMERSLRPGADTTGQRHRAGAVRLLRRRLTEAAERLELASIDELEGHRRYDRDLQRLRRFAPQVDGIRSAQAHLRCDGFLVRRARDGVLDAWTGRALRAWHDKHMIISLASRLDEATRATMVMDSRELDYLSTLRALRERVVDATGVLEDGTAGNDWGTVHGRQLNIDDEYRWVSRLDPLPHAAPDLVSRFTEAAATQLGWTDPEATRAWLEAHASERQGQRLVAVRLPDPPDYHSSQMDLRVEIHRGDVFYAFPYTDDGRPRGRRVRRRPTTTIYARRDDGVEVALVRWNTTIGGWQPERNPEGGVGMRYKESDVGARVWRDVIAGPAWLPPPSTPDEELLRRTRDSWRVNTSITGPGYDSAYGLAMVIHHEVRGEGDDADWRDNGIRSHGSVSYRSILRGYSHGCHRLFNHLAVRMMGFLLNHRAHQVHGQIAASLRRELHAEGLEEPLYLELTSRGYRYELTPPVPVEVLRGNVRGNQRRPLLGFYPLPEELQAQAAEQMATDPSTP